MDGSYGGYPSYQNNGMDKKDFKKIAQTVGSNIQKISQNVLSMKKMVNMLGTSQDCQDLRQKLHQIQHYTNNLAKDTTSSIKELNVIPMPPLSSEQRECKMQKERLAEEFTTALNAFQEIQRRAYQKEREEVQRNRTNAGLPPPPSKFNDYGDTQLIELQDSNSSRQSQAQMQSEILNLELMEEQEEAIRQLERDISDVNQIFKELGALVHEQGETIDSIEASVEKAEVLVGNAGSDLRSANTYTNKLRKKKLFIILFLGFILLLLVILIAWQAK